MNEGRRKTDEFLYKCRSMMPNEAAAKRCDYVLELGTGVENFLPVMFADYDNFHATDKDIYPGCVPGIVQLDAEDFDSSPLIDEVWYWDTILFCESLEHCPHPWKVFSEAYKHLRRPHGMFVVTVPCYYPIHEGLTGKGEGRVWIKDYWRFTPTGLAQLFLDAGFKQYYVEGLYHDGDDRTKTYSVVGWGITGDFTMKPYRNIIWEPPLPRDWVEKHEAAEKRWLEKRELIIWRTKPEL